MTLPTFSYSIALAATQLGIVLAPIITYGACRRSKKICAAALLTLALGLLQSAILFAPNFGCLAWLQYNWLQKVTMLLCTLALARRFGFSSADCGFAPPKYRSALVVGLFVGILFVGIDAMTGLPNSRPSTETVLFQLTIPGLHEEFFYRGLLLCIWDKCFGRPWSACGVEFGAGCIITTLLFTVGHQVALDDHWKVNVNLDILGWIDLVLFSLAMCWLRYRSGSVWPAVIAHNANNGLVQVIALTAHS
ncbi:MAG: CPBP family intramembrane metalloprotease [Candidatus Obscuribacterales bacterium]|nr:CPBP family intramembrane metalloprotease [Candidatus Obscuribacterales bacterium]